ncbi:hypothetical protein FEP07_00840 [Burkholderia multivorans]|nr:hypothetical protein [Burkholderia multivorans]MDR9265502.1 hypothetical protein [Burkholderia multivorans]MDR9283637.1 hypothetical protein [Burkholderia multivorans]MDR9289556.1 hypothetical protein [Burkholderia multivorans]MDR9311646.1 hypothetical protein [Burkholderia multivorans]
MAVPAGRPRRPTGTRRPRASHVHVQNEPVGPDGTKGRALRRRDRRRDEGAGRSAIHVCDTVRGDTICFHSVVPVSDASDLLKRPPSTVRRRSRLRLVSTRKERTMRGRTRPCGVRSGVPRTPHGQVARERFETETCEAPVQYAAGTSREPRRRATALHARAIDVASMHCARFPYDRPTRRTVADLLLAMAPRGPAHFDQPPQRTTLRQTANGCPSTQRRTLRRAAPAHRRATR